MLTQEQLLSIVRWVITSFGGYFIGRGWLTADQLTMLGGAAAAIVPLAWSFYRHRTAGTMAAVGALPGVARVEILATPDVAKIAASGASGPKVVAK